MWNEFLPISMPVTATAELSFWDMACSLSGRPLTSLSLVGQEHGRTIPLADKFESHASNELDAVPWMFFVGARDPQYNNVLHGAGQKMKEAGTPASLSLSPFVSREHHACSRATGCRLIAIDRHLHRR